MAVSLETKLGAQCKREHDDDRGAFLSVRRFTDWQADRQADRQNILLGLEFLLFGSFRVRNRVWIQPNVANHNDNRSSYALKKE